MSEAPAVAVDLGVTTVAAAIDAGGPPGADRPPADGLDPIGVPGADGPVDLAAVFAPADGSALRVGAEARRLAATDPSRYEPTPRLRAGESDLLLGTSVVGVAEAWGAVLAGALARAGPRLRGGRPRHLVLTHPAGWDAGRREVLRRAGSGLAEHLTLVAEPVAVAAHAAWMRPATGPAPGRIAVLDLGARAASAAVLAPAADRAGSAGGARLLAHRTADRFGGDDADEMLLGHLLGALADDPVDATGNDRVREVVAAATLADRRHRQVLLDDVRSAKERLSDAEQVAVPLPGRTTAAWLSRSELTEVLRGPLRGVVDVLADTLADAAVEPGRLDGVWLTGGGARLPLLAALVHREIGVPATVAPDPRLVVVRGALVAGREVEARRRPAPAVGTAVGVLPVVVPPLAVPAPVPDPSTDELPAPAGPDVPDPRVTDTDPEWLTPTSPAPGDAHAPVDDLTDPRPVPAVRASRPAREGPTGAGRRPARRPTARPGRGPRPGLAIGVIVALVATVTAVVLVVRAVSGPDGVPTVVGRQQFVAPPSWVVSGSDAASRRVLLRPVDVPRGTDLVAIQENPLDEAAAGDPVRARAQLAAQFDAARRAGDAVSGFEPSTEFAGREVARYRQDTSPRVRVDWVVVVAGSSMVSVGCRHGVEADDTTRVLDACERIVETLGPAD